MSVLTSLSLGLPNREKDMGEMLNELDFYHFLVYEKPRPFLFRILLPNRIT